MYKKLDNHIPWINRQW